MADPICRWRNPYFKTVREFINILPKEILASKEGREFTNKNFGSEFFGTPYQLACQLGLYYENNNEFIPRFLYNPSPSEIHIYLKKWIINYYVPNPYTKKGFDNIEPIVIHSELCKFLYEEKNNLSWNEVKNNLFKEEIGNDDILINSINTYSDVIEITSSSLKLKNNITYDDLPSYFINIENVNRNDKEFFFKFLDKNILSDNNYSNVSQKIIFEKQKLKWIIFNTFKLLLETKEEKTLLEGYKIKESKINDTIYDGLFLSQYFGTDNLIGIFKTKQTKNDLKSSNTERYFEETIEILGNEFAYFTTQWGDTDGKYKTLINFNNYLSDKSNGSLEIIKDGGLYTLISKVKDIVASPLKKTEQIIYYGAPGTGKSYKVDEILKSLNSKFYERITFHPDFDNATFVGGYKPVTEKIDNKDEIKYRFVPQAFTSIYKRAWNDLDNQYYLVIEEINRGNCAEIFGEIFQLLDRSSNYTVSPSKELQDHLNNVLTNKDGIINGLKLPPNLSILATMNTSDQSLFPMDSAFKRRWEWEYIPICYDPIDELKKSNISFDYEIDIEDGEKYSWIKFIEKINLNYIKENQSLGMDKCIGNYFIKPDNNNTISLRPFINKVVFYLWNDVFKDEENKVFEEKTSYEDFFPIKTNGKLKIKELFERIELRPKPNLAAINISPELGFAAENEE